MDTEATSRARARMAERIARESKDLPYRWGYFQGAILIPWSLFLIFATIFDLRNPNHEPLYISVTVFLLGLVGLPLGVGLLMRRRFALMLVYATFGLALLLAAITTPVAIKHYRDSGSTVSAFSEAEALLVWLCSIVYYRRRKAQFR